MTRTPHTAQAARVYASLRTAHLERFRTMTPALTLYHRTRYDFDESLVDPRRPPLRVSRVGAVRHLLGHGYDAVELNEPSMHRRWPDLLAQVIAIRLRSRLTGRPTTVSAYCISLSDPVDELVSARPRLPRPLAQVVTTAVLRTLVRSMDRLAFGSQGSLDALERHAGGPRLSSRARLFPALPSPCACLTGASGAGPGVEAGADGGGSVLFVGAFDDRKGVRQLMEAWDARPAAAEAATLTLVGTGRLQPVVTMWAAGRRDVDVVLDPPRSEVHAALRRADVLVLLSQRVGTWREQVGLPIVEGLAHGCTVVASDETGIADWLRVHGHRVVASGEGAADTGAVIGDAALAPLRRSTVLGSLPVTDTRTQADAWMLTDASVPPAVVFPEGRGVAAWSARAASSPVPGRWPHGLDQLGSGTDPQAIEVPPLTRWARATSATGGPRRRPATTAGPRVALSWDEQTAVRMVASVEARRMYSGVIWATDSVARAEQDRAIQRLRRALVQMDGLWCLSRPQVDAVRAWLGPSGPPTRFLRFGVDADFYRAEPYPSAPLVASVGGDRDRDTATLYAALEEVLRRHPGVRCVVRTTSRLTPPAGVESPPHLPHDAVRSLFACASVVAIATRPNLHVSGMTVALEAMAVGRPVVVTGTPGMEDYVEGGRTGLVVPPASPPALAEAVSNLLRDPRLAATMGREGRAVVEEELTSRAMCRRLLEMVG